MGQVPLGGWSQYQGEYNLVLLYICAGTAGARRFLQPAEMAASVNPTIRKMELETLI
jgi:hypothetical protein